ncbi:YihY/virulence factor BrkB family protein [uncultured Metabacillus sp.]|uniref:YihY/virulence factor BrkB family protein n=1 Tax=Metabacillus sp. Hm71 TaxID=3450743 RepID=UPI002602ED31|nr:YihY/virulence factor BrkB family protein [uncultured Metabacillus sp.]
MQKENSFLKELILRFTSDEVAGLAAQLSYFFLLSLFPFLIFLITLIGYLPISQDEVLGTIEHFAPGQSMLIIEQTLDQIINQRNGGLLSFGILATLWSASNGLNAIVRAFNKAYDVEETRSFLAARGMAILLTVAMVFVIVVALLLPVFGREIGLIIFSNFGFSDEFLTIWNTLRWLVSGIILFIVFSVLYYAAPNKHLHIKDGLPGSFAATIGWIAVSLAFSYYVANFANYSATYGSIGGVIVLMIWFYLSGMIIILGGELNALLYKRKHAA